MDTSLLESIIQRIFFLLGVQAPVCSFSEDGRVFWVHASSLDPHLYIGEQGRSLDDIQHIIRALARKHLIGLALVSVDVNGYKKDREDRVREIARSAADEVALFRAPKELSPMNSGDRRVVHMELASRTDVETESIGEGPERRVVVRLKRYPAES
ncbi:MAG: hypothetical protein HY482_01015 [Candidatus Wildermuthbacteria bacterium]|nr:hypothetical protein [Candidatus Wildermuthbacteria bacterium]